MNLLSASACSPSAEAARMETLPVPDGLRPAHSGFLCSSSPGGGGPRRPRPSVVEAQVPGVASDWKGFSWTELPNQSPLLTVDDYASGLQLVSWTGGFAVRGTMNGGDDSAR